MSVERTPVGVIRIGNEGVGVVCDDGSLWWLNDDHREWRELPSVPGTEREVAHWRKRWLAAFEARFGDDLVRQGGTAYPDFLVRLAVLHHGMRGESLLEAEEIARHDLAPGLVRDIAGIARDVLRREGWPEFVRKKVTIPEGQ